MSHIANTILVLKVYVHPTLKSTYRKSSPNLVLHLEYEQQILYDSQYNKMRDSSLLAYNDRFSHRQSFHLNLY